jgi:hypothetical protein
MKAPSDPMTYALFCLAASNGILPYPAKSAIHGGFALPYLAFVMYR